MNAEALLGCSDMANLSCPLGFPKALWFLPKMCCPSLCFLCYAREGRCGGKGGKRKGERGSEEGESGEEVGEEVRL